MLYLAEFYASMHEMVAMILVQPVLVAETWHVLKKYVMLMQGVGGNSRHKQKNQSFKPVEEN